MEDISEIERLREALRRCQSLYRNTTDPAALKALEELMMDIRAKLAAASAPDEAGKPEPEPEPEPEKDS